MKRIVHPVCDRNCRHEGAVPVHPGPKNASPGAAVLAGPGAFLPTEIGPPVYTAPPAPFDPIIFARPRPQPAQSFPAPLVVARPALDLPRAVKSLQEAAEAFGWTTEPTEAEGWYPHAIHGTPGSRPKKSIALRMRRGTEGAVAVYVSGSAWSWEYLYYWSPVQSWTKLRTLGDFLGAIA